MTNQTFENERPPLLALTEATVMRGGVAVLNAMSLTIREGEHTAILGPNGCGKTTLIKALTREHYPLMRPGGEPSIRIFGKAAWDVTELRSLLGIVTSDLHQTFVNAGGVSAFEAALSGFFGSIGLARHHAIEPDMPRRALEALAEMDALHLAERPLEELSTGEARRVLIARALVSDPRALLLDEPTTGLDLAATHHFLETIRSVIRRGKTLALVTHHTEEIVPEIERVVLLREGRVFREGAKADVLTSANLSALYGAPVRVQPAARPGYFFTQMEDGGEGA